MNINSDHPILGALFEKWRKEKDLNIKVSSINSIYPLVSDSRTL